MKDVPREYGMKHMLPRTLTILCNQAGAELRFFLMQELYFSLETSLHLISFFTVYWTSCINIGVLN